MLVWRNIRNWIFCSDIIALYDIVSFIITAIVYLTGAGAKWHNLFYVLFPLLQLNLFIDLNFWFLCILFFFGGLQKFMVLGWIVGPLLLIIMIFGPTKKELSPIAAILYTSIGKTAWALGIAWFIVACATGRGGIVNRILSAKCLLPYSRMTYTAYLINPLCIMFVVMSCEAPIHLDFLSLVCVCA